MPEFLPDTPEVRSDLLDYYLEIEWYDAQLGKALRVLEETGELENTLIVVTSDNGMPFPHAKVNLYDWGVPMPLALRWGGEVAAGAGGGAASGDGGEESAAVAVGPSRLGAAEGGVQRDGAEYDVPAGAKTPHRDIYAAPTKEVLLDATAATRFPKQVAWCLAKRPGQELYEVGTDPRQVKNMAEDARYAGQREAARTRKTHKPE